MMQKQTQSFTRRVALQLPARARQHRQLGMTEGHTRIAVGSGPGISSDFETGRPILGRAVNVQLRYRF